jgi:hypothetical protein
MDHVRSNIQNGRRNLKKCMQIKKSLDQERTYKWVQDRLHDLHSGTISDADRIRLEEMAKSILSLQMRLKVTRLMQIVTIPFAQSNCPADP